MTEASPRHCVRFHQHFAAPIKQVFEFMLDHEQFGRIWPGAFRRIQDAPAGTNPNGLGSVREIRIGPIRFEETIVTCEPHSLIEYRVTRGSPIRNHLGRMAFSAVGNGTELDYVIRFDARIPCTGRLIENSLVRDWNRGIASIVAELEAAAG